MSRPPLISCQSISKSFGTQTLFSNISLGFFENERLGLIGPNGSGKTTLLKILSDIETSTTGKVSRKRGTRVVYLSQDDLLDSKKTILETLFFSNPEAIDNWESNKEIRILIETMAFEDINQKVGTLSGGWQKRVAITAALIQRPDLLLLDEPTNHLDLEGILWLEALLLKARFAFVLVSHDRTFLEHTCNRIVELNKRYANGFIKVEGSYSRFLEKREEILNDQMRREQNLSSKVRREIAWLARGPKARTTKAKYRIDNAAVLQSELEEVKGRNAKQQSAQIKFDASGRKTKRLIVLKNVTQELGDKMLFKNLSLTLSPGQCLGLLGKNGSGKSTLIHLLNGELKQDSGSIQFADDLKIVTFGQKREQLDQNQSLRQALCPAGDQVIFRDRPIHIVSWAKRFLFSESQLALPVSRLSGGEQARVLIANLMLKPADILLLDEPTNDLDIPTLEVLEESLEEFSGAIVLITHDRFLLDQLSDELLSIEGLGRTAFYADVYQWQQGQQAQGNQLTGKTDIEITSPSQKKSDQNSVPKITYEERKELSRIEKKIEKATEQIEAVKLKLNDPAIQSDAGRLIELSEEVQEAEKKVEGLYRRWEELEVRNG